MKIEVWVGVGLCGCDRKDEIEIDDEEWESLTDDERDQWLDDEATNFRDNVVECGARVIK